MVASRTTDYRIRRSRAERTVEMFWARGRGAENERHRKWGRLAINMVGRRSDRSRRRRRVALRTVLTTITKNIWTNGAEINQHRHNILMDEIRDVRHWRNAFENGNEKKKKTPKPHGTRTRYARQPKWRTSRRQDRVTRGIPRSFFLFLIFFFSFFIVVSWDSECFSVANAVR